MTRETTILIVFGVIMIAFVQAGFFGGIADGAKGKSKKVLFAFLSGPFYWLIAGGVMLQELLIDWSRK